MNKDFIVEFKTKRGKWIRIESLDLQTATEVESMFHRAAIVARILRTKTEIYDYKY